MVPRKRHSSRKERRTPAKLVDAMTIMVLISKKGIRVSFHRVEHYQRLRLTQMRPEKE